jgi:hypothetical protein
MKKTTSVLAGLAIAASTLVIGAQAANAATPTITVSPKTNVKSGTSVSISASGFKSGATIAAVQCKVAKPGPGGKGCNIKNYVLAKVGANGKAKLKLKVSKTSGKYISVGSIDQKQHAKSVAITFK